MRLVFRFFAAASVAVALAFAMSDMAYADDGQIMHVVAADGKVQVVFEAPGLAEGASLDPSTVRLHIGDQLLPSTGELLRTGNTKLVRASLLVIDTSKSMQGEALQAAKAAANQFLASVPDDVQVGLITFADTATRRLAPIKNHDAVKSVVDALAADGATALYDGLNMAVSQLTGPDYSNAVRNIVLLTDGKDEGSTTRLPSLLSRLEESGIAVDAVAFRSTAAVSVLQKIVDAGPGRLVQADEAGALSAAFKDSARAISNQVLITAALPGEIDAGAPTVTVDVSTRGGVTTFTDQAVMVIGADALPAEQPRVEPAPVGVRGWTSSERTLQIALALVFLGAVVVLGFVAAAFASGRRESIMRERLAPYTLRGSGAHRPLPPPPSASGSEVNIARAAVGLAEKVVANKDLEDRLARRLEAAAIPMKPAEWLLLHTGIALGVPLLLLLVSGGDMPLTLVGLLIGAAGPYVYLIFKQSKRKQKFEESLAPTLQLFAGSLAAGHSLPQAVDTVAQEASEPMASELRRAVAEARLAVTIEDALDHVAERTGSKDFAWVAMAVRIQRNVGGNLAELLTTVAATLRERERLRRHVRVLSAEGRLSAIILGALPILFAFYLFVVRREYLMKLFTDPLGVAMVIAGSVIFVVSILVMVRLVKVEV